MSNIKQTAQAFAWGNSAECHNATTDGTEYRLHGNRIAWKDSDGIVWGSFCGWYGPTTLNHLKHVAEACGAPGGFGYSKKNRPECDPFQII